MTTHKDTINTERILADMLREHAEMNKGDIDFFAPQSAEISEAIDRISELEQEILNYPARTIADLATKAKFAFEQWAESPHKDAILPDELSMPDHALWALMKDAERLATPQNPQAIPSLAELIEQAKQAAQRHDFAAITADDTDPDTAERRKAEEELSQISKLRHDLTNEIMKRKPRTLEELSAKAAFLYGERAASNLAFFTIVRDCEEIAGPSYAELFQRWQDKRREYATTQSDEEGETALNEALSIERKLLSQPTTTPEDHARKICVAMWRLGYDGEEDQPGFIALKAVADALDPEASTHLKTHLKAA